MDATDDNSPLLAIYYDIRERNRAQLRRAIAQDVGLNSLARLPGTAIWLTKNASHDGRQIRAGKR
jgi:hypothetical protein